MLRFARKDNVIISVVLDMNDSGVHPAAGSADEQEFIHYAVDRFGAFSNITWDMDHEANGYRTDQWIHDTGTLLEGWDPYKHLATIHPEGDSAAHQDRYSAWFGFTSNQEWVRGQAQHELMLESRKLQEKAGRIIPQTNEEYGYEDYNLFFIVPGTDTADALRRTAWAITMAGGYGDTGETAKRGTNIWPNTGGGWMNGRGDDTMTMLLGYGHMVDFFTGFDWWKTNPDDQLVNKGNWCVAEPGKIYAVYLPNPWARKGEGNHSTAGWTLLRRMVQRIERRTYPAAQCGCAGRGKLLGLPGSARYLRLGSSSGEPEPLNLASPVSTDETRSTSVTSDCTASPHKNLQHERQEAVMKNETSLSSGSRPQMLLPKEADALRAVSSGNQRLADLSRRTLLKLASVAMAGAGVEILKWPASALAEQNRFSNRKLRFGLNYVPRKNWWYIWENWDAQAISEDLRAISDLGMDHIRIQCLWPFFQPGINYIEPVIVNRVLELLDLAAGVNLDVEITVLNGWMSGYAFLPPWVAPLKSGGNIFTNEKIIEAEKLLFQSFADAVCKHERFMGFDLGNEIDVLQGTTGNQATLSEADHWANAMFSELEQLAPEKFHVNGVDHLPWFADSGFSRHNLATAGSATVLHCYAYFTGALKCYRYNEPGSLHLLEYMVELAKAYHQDDGRQVWVEEVGTSSEWMPEEYIPEYATALLRNATSCGGIWGFTWWCSHDIDPSIKGFQSLEYTLGVLDTKNRVKPIGRTLARLAEEMRRNPPEPLKRSVALVIPDNKFPSQGRLPGWTIAKQFMDMIEKNRRPTIILESRAKDDRYLQARGIEELVQAKAMG
ncbi:MAG: DUF4038 domain-containing protein [Acidobacteriaceae bacterium]